MAHPRILPVLDFISPFTYKEDPEPETVKRNSRVPNPPLLIRSIEGPKK
jgi:hypothetical protein